MVTPLSHVRVAGTQPSPQPGHAPRTPVDHSGSIPCRTESVYRAVLAGRVEHVFGYLECGKRARDKSNQDEVRIISPLTNDHGDFTNDDVGPLARPSILQGLRGLYQALSIFI